MAVEERLVGEYGTALQKTTPPGRALTVKPGGQLEALMRGLGAELAAFAERTMQLLTEADPRQAAELLPEWERMVGLPNECTGVVAATSGRRAAVVARLRSAGGANPALIKQVLEGFRFEGVEIVEYEAASVDSADCESPIYSTDWAFVWDVEAPEVNPVFFRVGESAVGEPLTENGNVTLACLVEEIAPAHTLPRVRFVLPASGSYQPWDPANFQVPALDVESEPLAPTLA